MIFKPYYYFETGCAAYLCDVPPKPAAMEQILRINQGRGGDTP